MTEFFCSVSLLICNMLLLFSQININQLAIIQLIHVGTSFQRISPNIFKSRLSIFLEATEDYETLLAVCHK